MAKDPSKNDPDKGDPNPDPNNDPDALGDAGKKALDAERRARREAEQKAADLQKRLDEADDKDKTELQKLTDQVAREKDRADKAESKALRLEVAMAKGLTAGQAKRLVGTTQTELETDADEILKDFGGAGKGEGGKETTDGPPSQRPKPTLRGGSDPTSETTETDPAKLAASVPRF